MSSITINGLTASRFALTLPAWGLPWGDADLADATPLPVGAPAEVLVLGVRVAMMVASGGVVEGRGRYRLVGGRGGWARPLAARAYANDLGVSPALVAADAAREAGEVLDPTTPPPAVLGPAYARAEGPASHTLHTLAPRGWRVTLDGVTTFGAPVPAPYVGTAPRVAIDPAGRWIELAIEDAADLRAMVPGVVVDGVGPALDVVWRLDGSRLSARAYAGADATPRGSRRLRALASIVEALDPGRRFRGLAEYRVVLQEGDALALQVARASSGLPDLPRVPMRMGVPGGRAVLVPGSLVLVGWADADPSRPAVVAFSSPADPGWAPVSLALGGDGALPVAYQGSTVQAGPFGGVVTLGSVRVAVVP